MLRLRCRTSLLARSSTRFCLGKAPLGPSWPRLSSSQTAATESKPSPDRENAQKQRSGKSRSRRRPNPAQRRRARAARAAKEQPTWPISELDLQLQDTGSNVSWDISSTIPLEHSTESEQNIQAKPPTKPDKPPPKVSKPTPKKKTTGSKSDSAPSANTWSSLRARLDASQKDADRQSIDKSKQPEEQEDSDKIATGVEKPRRGRKKSPAVKAKAAVQVNTIKPHHLHLQPVELDKILDVPKLCHNLDRVLFNPGVYEMQDRRSRVFNFDPHLASIMPVKEFDFNALKAYITSSKDTKLLELCKKHGRKYCGSTSSMTNMLSHFHFLISAWRHPRLDHLSKSLSPESLNFTALSRGPAAVVMRYSDGVYAIDADKEYDTENVLSMLGKSMEKLLTLPKEEFDKYRRTRSHQITEEQRNADESFHYTTFEDFMMRSQLDAHDPRIPGTGMFDLKTRAVVSIRMDVQGYEKGTGYEIRKRFGQWESFEREYYDMIRAAFLKYSLQVRMGRMDGIFVAFHNTQRIFGFQYISLQEMDYAIHGTEDLRIGDQEFKSSLSLLNDLLDRATKRFPGQSLRIHVETRPTKVPLTYFFVEPVTEEEIDNHYKAKKPWVEQLQHNIQDLSNKEREDESAERERDALAEQQQQEASEPARAEEDWSEPDPEGDAAWKEMMERVSEAVEDDTLGIASIREATQDALEQSGLLQEKSEAESEEYLDAVVNALTTHSLESRDPRDPAATQDAGSVEGASVEDLETAAAMDQPTTQSASLRDLILKVTEQIDERSHTLAPAQRKFADLVSGSKQDSRASDANDEEPTSSAEQTLAAESELSADEGFGGDSSSGTPETPEREILGMIVTVRNNVNGQFVERPEGGQRDFKWKLEYTVTEFPQERARATYEKIKKRRKAVLESNPSIRSANWYRMFQGKLSTVSKRGEVYRQRKTVEEAGQSVYVAWDEKPQGARR